MKPILLRRVQVHTAKRAVFAGLVAPILRALERSRQRRALHGLSDAQLRDVGLTRGEIEVEARKPFWR